MNAYALARKTWEDQGEGDPEWHELIAHFLNTPGHALVNVPGAFILARQVNHTWPDMAHDTLSPLQYPGEPDCWNVWLAAGNLDALLIVAQAHPLEWLSYNRRAEQRVRRVKLQTILRRHDAKNAQANASAPTGHNE
jgi:Zn-finger nucleic acid-binding protein